MQTAIRNPRGASRQQRAGREIAVIGAGLGGLSAAIHLSLAGYKVTMFEANERTGGRANLLERDGFRFDTGPSLLNYPWVFERLFEAAGRSLYDYVSLIPVEPSVAFRWPDGTQLRLSSDREFLEAEFERVAPGSAEGLRRFFSDAGEKYRLAFEKLACRNEDNAAKWFGALSIREALATGVWRSLYSELQRFFRSAYICEALGSYGMYLGGSPFDLPGLFSILPYGEMRYGLWLPRGGVYALVAAVERLARELGVRIELKAPVARIATRNGEVRGVEMARGQFEPFGTVVSNVDAPTTEMRLLERPDPGMRMTPGVLTFYWGVRGSPENLGHHTIFLPRDYRGAFADLMRNGAVPGELPFYVAVPSESDPQLAPPGHSAVFVLVPMPVLSRLGPVDWGEMTAAVREQVLARLGQHGAKLEIVSESAWTPRDWQHRFGLHDGSAFGAAHTLFQVGPFRFRNRSRHTSGLFYVGSSTTPGAGMPMVVLGGKMVAERVEAHVR